MRTNEPQLKPEQQEQKPENHEKLSVAWKQGGKGALRKALEEIEEK